MVWFDGSLRFELCEDCMGGSAGIIPVKTTFTGIDGWSKQ